MDTFELPLPDDFHVHLRQDAALADYTRDVAREFGRVLVMPNTVPPLTTVAGILDYKRKILDAAPGLVPLMTFKLSPAYSEDVLVSLKKAGVVAGKYYPAGVTTNSQDGVSDFESVLPVIARMERLGFVLCIHGEEPGAFCLDRETEFISRVEYLAEHYPKLRIVFEHLSTAKAVEAVKRLSANVAATITVHHLLHTLDDVIGGSLRPHHFCKPLPKRPEDRDALRAAAFSGNPKFFLGTDSAPHTQDKKECPCGAAGVYSVPVAVPILIQLFEKFGKMDRLPDFVAGFGADFYGLPRNTQTRTYVRRPWVVPESVHGVVPLAAGMTLDWSLYA
ncbi:MAG: dihydroorotase [Fibrobacteraceae bacterium]